MLRKLSLEEIEKLSNRPSVRRIAVENFLMTLTNNPDEYSALANLQMDAKLYKWNKETVKAIKDGIKLACKRVK